MWAPWYVWKVQALPDGGGCPRCGAGWEVYEERVPGISTSVVLRDLLPSHLWGTHVRIVEFLLSPPMLRQIGHPSLNLENGTRCLGWAGTHAWLGGTSLFLFRQYDAWQGHVRFLPGRRINRPRLPTVYTCRLVSTAPAASRVPASVLYDLLGDFRDFALSLPLCGRDRH